MQQDPRETQTWRVLLLVPGQASTLALNLSLLSLTFLIPVPAHGLMPQAPLHHMKRCPTGLIWIIEMKVRDQLRVLGGLWYTCKYFALQHGLSSHWFFFWLICLAEHGLIYRFATEVSIEAASHVYHVAQRQGSLMIMVESYLVVQQKTTR